MLHNPPHLLTTLTSPVCLLPSMHTCAALTSPSLPPSLLPSLPLSFPPSLSPPPSPTVSAAVTAVFLFWYYRGVMVQGLIWYIVLQCLFLFFQCVTTDIFAVYAPTSANQPDQGLHPNIPVTTTGTSSSNNTAGGPLSQTAQDMFATATLEPFPTPAP